jgi:glycosyltransferase involved in cell wall biosynthesis
MNSPDEAVFGPPRDPVSWALGEPVRAVYHGGVAERFGPDVLVEALARLGPGAGVTVDVYGAGEEREHVAALAARAAPGLVRVAPEAIPFQDIPGRLADAHIGIVPTLHDHFTELLLPVKLLEYVHMGMPAICSRLPCIEHYFSAEELVWFEPGDAASLADAIRRTVADPAAARERARAAALRLREIAWSRQRETYLGVLDRLAGRAVAQQPVVVPAAAEAA